MYADLHCHSFYSDGKHSPDYLLARACELGLTHLAITDHDCIDAYSAMQSSDKLQVICGVEISAAWNNREIHVVGLGIDRHCAALQALLDSQQASRRERLLKIQTKLQQAGIEGLADFVAGLPCRALTRSHVADFLVSQGHCKNYQKAFRRFLGKKGRAWVAADWCSVQKAVAVIRDCGGIAVLAHPGRYSIGKRQLLTLIDDFKATGGEALEASYGNIDPLMQKKLTELALARGLYLSQGSDFHDQAASWTDLGKFPALGAAAKKNAIWQHPGWHF